MIHSHTHTHTHTPKKNKENNKKSKKCKKETIQEANTNQTQNKYPRMYKQCQSAFCLTRTSGCGGRARSVRGFD